LYYYLPLTNANKNNPISTINIPNNTVLNNAALWTGRVTSSATITSQNNIGAKYTFYDSTQKIYGIYARDLQPNEKIQFSTDAGLTWSNVDTAFANQWIATLPANFRYGVIQVRGYLNNAATNRNFNSYKFVIAPGNLTYQYNRIDTLAGSSGNINSVVSIDNGGSSNLKYRISNGQINGINIDSVTGTISLDAIIEAGYYPITVYATNEIGSTNKIVIINIKPIIDSIIGFSNSTFQTTTASTGANGDYVRLPTLDMSGSYTIETWFKNTGTLGNQKRVFDFSSGANNNGVFLSFSSATQITFLQRNNAFNTNLPADFISNGWNHIAVSYDNSTVRLYINGVQVNQGNNFLSIDSNTCTSNFIARSNYLNDATTQGEFREFRIWKIARTASEIKSNLQSFIPQPAAGLYYYLPLTNAN
ncbi:MAG: LamG domain-containing protein, partial [Sediminibacterium sp.]|nr:LamG domain-containing protein [Sediminibacterium sp.]